MTNCRYTDMQEERFNVTVESVSGFCGECFRSWP